MKSTAKQVAALDKVMQICDAHGASYNPSNEAILPTALASLLEQAQEKTKAVNVARVEHAMAITARAKRYTGIPTLAVRILRHLAAAGLPKDQLEDAREIKRLFFPKPAKKSVVATTGDTTAKKERRQRGLDRASILAKFKLLVEHVQRVPVYKPNDPEFQVAQLNATLAELQALNLAAIQARIKLNDARVARNELMNGPGGVAEITRLVQEFIRAKFGVYSPQALNTKPSMNA